MKSKLTKTRMRIITVFVTTLLLGSCVLIVMEKHDGNVRRAERNKRWEVIEAYIEREWHTSREYADNPDAFRIQSMEEPAAKSLARETLISLQWDKDAGAKSPFHTYWMLYWSLSLGAIGGMFSLLRQELKAKTQQEAFEPVSGGEVKSQP